MFTVIQHHRNALAPFLLSAHLDSEIVRVISLPSYISQPSLVLLLESTADVVWIVYLDPNK